ncbi:low temperature requirement protein A [Streptomyces sp. NPDC091217]|uniref:low temperature requirement protein A n=1 Tax=Streptomyces sp. NPDC091217 TaxID=3365975 RepID=UPI0037F2656A
MARTDPGLPRVTGTPGTPLTPDLSGERHASWLELFFDLVAVAGVAQLAHLLRGEPGWRDVGLYIVLYLAFWTDWMSLTLYGNVAAERTRTRTLLLGMFGLTVMAAAVHGIQEGELGRAFAIAYVTTRALGSRVFGERREVLVDWPTVSFTAGAVPWTISIWAGDPARPWLWAFGVVIDLYVVFVFSKDRLLHNLANRRQGRRHDRPEASASGDDAGTAPDTGLTVVHTDTEHLAERLGLFTIIVLGEGVYQLVEATSEAAEWNRELFAAVTGAFVLLVLLWSQSLNRGRGGVPGLRHAALPPRLLLGLHCCVTGALAALAAGLGVVVEHAGGRLPRADRLADGRRPGRLPPRGNPGGNRPHVPDRHRPSPVRPSPPAHRGPARARPVRGDRRHRRRTPAPPTAGVAAGPGTGLVRVLDERHGQRNPGDGAAGGSGPPAARLAEPPCDRPRVRRTRRSPSEACRVSRQVAGRSLRSRQAHRPGTSDDVICADFPRVMAMRSNGGDISSRCPILRGVATADRSS